ncbi:MAG: polysaccharide biosynthesis protein [Flavobacteriales bacterium]|nr:polysaccharide biosynthesis protein [Flavobacteriales bacterium]
MVRQGLFPRWGVIVVDLALCLVALGVAYSLRFNFSIPQHELDLLWPVLPIFLLVRLVSFLIAGIHRVMVRHTNTQDARRIFLTVLGGSLTFLLIGAVRYFLVDEKYLLPLSIIAIDFMATAMLMISTRIVFKLLHLRAIGAGKEAKNVVIYGAGEAGLITKRTLERAGTLRYEVVAFVDDDTRKAGKLLEGATIFASNKLSRFLADKAVDEVIIAIGRPDPENRRKVVDAAMKANVKVLTIPPVNDWINGQLSAGQIQEVRIEDLLGRPVIHLDEADVIARFKGKRVLVTGAAGSIGSELVRQLAKLDVASLALVDIAESGLYDIEMELLRSGNIPGTQVIIADVRDELRMNRVFSSVRPQVVFHAAAYKHVPLMAAQPAEAVRTNILGTRNVAEQACIHGVEQFVLISTDKAVNPTSVMGASKRIAEMVIDSMASKPGAPQFITTRFGNVLGSSGSVIPLFRKQLAAGGPLTVTDPQVTRFFMTIPEACRLVLEAATMGKGREIYVFDMGEPMRIADLADKMIRLSGLEPGKDIEIAYTGLRPGEKLYEELLATTENTLPTHHPRILIGKVRPADPEQILLAVVQLTSLTDEGNNARIVAYMKALVPEYRSHNSVFSNLDAPSTKP